MGGSQIFDVDVVTHPGAIGCVVVGTKYRHVRTRAYSDLAGDFGEQSGFGGALSDTATRVCTGHVEITQDYVAHAIDC